MNATRPSARASTPPITRSVPAIIRPAAAGSTYPKGNDDVPKAQCPLRQDPRARDALSARRPGLGRADRLGASAGRELAARVLRRARAQRGTRGGLVWQSARSTITPWVVQVDKLGDGAGGGVGGRRLSADRPPDRLAPRALHRRSAQHSRRSGRAAPGLARGLQLRHRQGRAGAERLRPRQRPFSKAGKAQVSVEVASVIRASEDSFRVAWVERRYVDNALAATERWSAILTIVVQTPTDADRLKKNPLGVYVHALNWSKELG